MLRITLFELKKLLARRVALVANLGVLAMLVGIMLLNVFQAKTESSSGEVLSGPEAIAYKREERLARAGTIDVERVLSYVAAYREEAFANVDPAEISQLTNVAAYSLMLERYDAAYVERLYDPYWSWLLSPFHLSGEEPYQTAARVTDDELRDYYGAVASLTQTALDAGQGGTWEYGEAERAFWTGLEAQVLEPLAYGWTGGWSNVIDCVAFLVFPMLAAAITLAPTFCAEYRSGADAVVLSARYGRSRLVGAKVMAAFLYVAGYMAVAAAIIVGFSLTFYGVDGFGLPVQALSLDCPYPITAGEAALWSVGLMLACALGIAGLTLLLSSRMSSTLPVFVTDVVLLMVTGMLPSGGSGVIEHVLALFPLGFSNFSKLFGSLTSFALGPVVLDLAGMVAVVWLVLCATTVPCAAHAFRHHQVA